MPLIFSLHFMMTNSRSKSYRHRPFCTNPPNWLEFFLISLKQYRSKHSSTIRKGLVLPRGYIFIIKSQFSYLQKNKNQLHGNGPKHLPRWWPMKTLRGVPWWGTPEVVQQNTNRWCNDAKAAQGAKNALAPTLRWMLSLCFLGHLGRKEGIKI